MKTRSKVIDFKLRKLIESERQLTPEQRLHACMEISALVADLNQQGEAYRAVKRPDSPGRRRK
jgi:hypothetical protein